MNFKPISFKFLGNLKEDSWSSAFEAGEDKLLLSRGKLWIIFSVRLKDDSFDRISLSREIFSYFYNKYYHNETASNFYTLRVATSETFSFYKDKFLDFELAATSYSQEENIVNSAVVNGSWAGVIRGGSFSKILESKEDVVAASGYPLQDDVFVFGTRSAFLPFSSLSVGELVIEGSFNRSKLDLLNQKFFSVKESERSALFFIGFFLPQKEFSVLDRKEEDRMFFQRDQKLTFGPDIGLLRQRLIFVLKKAIFRFYRNKGDRRVFVRSTFRSLDEKDEEKRRIVVPVLLIIFILGISLFGHFWREAKKKEDFLSSKLNEALQKTEDAKNIFLTDYQASRELLWSAKETLSFLEKERYKSKRLLELAEKIKEQEEKVLREYYIFPSVFVDLTLLSADFKVEKLVSDGSSIVVFDKEGKRVARISFENKKTEAVSGPSDFEEYQAVALYTDDVFVLTKKGFFNVKNNSKMLFRNDFGEGVFIYYYAGNVYVLDKDASRIYRINSSGGEFSLPQIWTASSLDIDFVDAKGWFIDGFIWVLFNDGRILKFSKGVPERVVLKNIFPKLENIQSIYSNEEANFLYVLDADLGRVVVFDKLGNYIAQYFSDEIKGARDLVVSEKEKRMVFSKEGGKLYLIEIKHLL